MSGFQHWQWHLGEMHEKLADQMVYLWRAVDNEGQVLESFASKTRNKRAALRFMKKALMCHGSPDVITTDGPRSYKASIGWAR